MIEKLLDFAREAGDIAVRNQMRAYNQVNILKDKTVYSVVTQTDKDISDMFRVFVQHHFSDLNYIIIDEESISQYGENVFNSINTAEYQFVIDPIDGTVLYENMLPMYGIVIGVFKNKKPILGLIYMPKEKDLVYFDGQKAYWVQNAFDRDEISTELIPNNSSKSPLIFASGSDFERTDDFLNEKFLILDYFSACSQLLYVLTGRAKALAGKASLWDIGGAMALADYLGMTFLSLPDGKRINDINSDFFNKDMGIQTPCLLCSLHDFHEILKILKCR